MKVLVRCRPMNGKEKELKCQKVVKIFKKELQIEIKNPKEPQKTPKKFTFDSVFDNDCTQKEVYMDSAYSLVQSVMEGYNGTIFAYGQTGCGKTWTMEGQETPETNRGIIPCSFVQIFREISMNTVEKRQFLVQCSYIEIYNENVRDLLSANSKAQLALKESKDKGVYVQGLSHTVVDNVEMLTKLMYKGNKNRMVGGTAMNAVSSRSHSIFIVKIETSEPDTSPGASEDDVKIKAGMLHHGHEYEELCSLKRCGD